MLDVVVIGGGVIGCAAARALALRGLRTAIVERGGSGRNASWAAAGMLSPLAEADRAGAFLDLLRASRRLYPSFVRELEEESGASVAYRDEGTLLVALDDSDEERLRRRYAWQRDAGLPVEWMEGEAARRLEPGLSERTRSALRFAEDHQVDNRLLYAALERAAERAGVDVRQAEAVRLVTEEGRAAGVMLGGGEEVRAAWVVVAAGAWSGGLQGLPREIPVRPVHGELLALEAVGQSLRHVLDSPRVYLVPRLDGRVIVGATMEEVGFERRVTAGGMNRLLGAAMELVPELGGAAVVETWSGHRPGTPDGRPILGPDPDVPNLVYATGHYRNGILLTPITAEIVEDIIVGEGCRYDLRPFSPDRFSR